MSVLFGITNLWCEIILVNDQHKTEGGRGFKVAINPAFTVIEWEGGDPINFSIVSTACALPSGQQGQRHWVVLRASHAAPLVEIETCLSMSGLNHFG